MSFGVLPGIGIIILLTGVHGGRFIGIPIMDTITIGIITITLTTVHGIMYDIQITKRFTILK